jgi:hypothetical protein
MSANTRTTRALLAGLTLVLASSAYAQNRYEHGSANTHTRVPEHVAAADANRASGTSDRGTDNKPLFIQDRDQFRENDIYGADLMTRKEHRQYFKKLDGMTSVHDWAEFRLQHQSNMMARARQRGVDLPAPYYGQQLMTDRERVELTARLGAAATQREREHILQENREMMRKRAREYDVAISELNSSS